VLSKARGHNTGCVPVSIDRCIRLGRRTTGRYAALRIVGRRPCPLAFFMGRRRFREYERCADVVQSLIAPPTTHGNPKDDHLWGERLTENRGTVRLTTGVLTMMKAWEDSTQKMLQT